MLTVLLTDAAFTGLIRCLRSGYGDQVRLVGLSTDENTAHQALLDAFYKVPSHRDPEYIDVLIRISKVENVDVIIPIITEGLEHLALSADKIRIETNSRVLTCDADILHTANDKGNLYAFLVGSPIKTLRDLVPLYTTAETKADLFYGIRTLQEQGVSVCIKRRSGEDAAGFFVIDPITDCSEYIFEGRIGKRISYDLLLKMLDSLADTDKIPPFLVSEYLPGEEWDVDVLCLNGKLLSATSRKNISMFGGLTSVLETQPNPFLIEYCRLIVEQLGLSYVACISFRARLDGTFCLLEINPRMMGNILASDLSGNNYAKMAIDLLFEKEVHPSEPVAGIRTALYYDQLRIDNVEAKKGL
jgi:carbamoyl-phosphate synthase large subunit